MVGFEKALRAVEVIKDQIQYRSQSLLNLARGYFKGAVGSADLKISKSALLMNHHNLSNTKPIYTE